MALSADCLGRIDDALDDLLLPHSLNLSILSAITHTDFLAHVERVGIVFYAKITAEVSH